MLLVPLLSHYCCYSLLLVGAFRGLQSAVVFVVLHLLCRFLLLVEVLLRG